MIFLERKNSILFKFLSFLLILSLLFMGVMPCMTPSAHAEAITVALVATGVAVGVGILLSNYSALTSEFDSYLSQQGSSTTDFLSYVSTTATSYILNSSAWALIYPFLNSYVSNHNITTTTSNVTTINGYSLGVIYSTISYKSANSNSTNSWTLKDYSSGDTYTPNACYNSTTGNYRNQLTTCNGFYFSTSTYSYPTKYKVFAIFGSDHQFIDSVYSSDASSSSQAISPNFNNNMNTYVPTPDTTYTFTSVGSDIDTVTKDSTVEISTSSSSTSGTTTGSVDLSTTNGILSGIKSAIDSFFDRFKSHADSFETSDDTVIPDFANSPPPFYEQPTITPNPDGSSYHGGWLKGLFLALGLDKLLDSINSFWSLVLEWLGSISAFLSFYASFLTLLPRAMVLPLYGSIVLGAILVFIRRFTA